MEILAQQHDGIHVETKQDDAVCISVGPILVVIKHNDVGLSIDFRGPHAKIPFRQDQVWFEDIPPIDQDDA